MNPLKRFLALYLPIAALVVLVTLAVGLTLIHSELGQLQAYAATQLTVGAELFSEELGRPLSHLRGLTREPAIQRAFKAPPAEARALMDEHLQTLMFRNAPYDQARWLGADGMELARVNRIGDEPVVVPQSDLQDKSKRPYYQEAIRLPPGQVFVSALDLNVEHEVVEVPHKPMIRMAIRLPVVAGHDQGLLVINLRAQHILDQLVRTAPRGHGEETLLLNGRGDLLLAPDPQEAWGFMFGRDITLAQRQPRVWARIAAAPTGQIRTDTGLWTWTTVAPAALQPGAVTASEDWTLVAQVPAAELVRLQWQQWQPLVVIAAVVLVLLGLGVQLYSRLLIEHEIAASALKAMDAKRLAEERLRLATDGAQLGIWHWDLGTKALDHSENFARLFGLAPGVTLDHVGVMAALHPDDRPRVEAAVAQAIATLGGVTLEHRILWPDGSLHWISTTVKVYGTDAGQPTSLDGVVSDITERKLAELELRESERRLRELSADLEHRVAVRTAELAAANTAKTEFIANMSHELRTPLTAVIGLSDLLLAGDLTARQRDYLGQVQGAGTALLGILNDILDYSRLESGDLSLVVKPLRIGDLLAGTRALFLPQAAEKQLALDYAVAPEVPPVLVGDPLRLQQVINNLVGNALKFTAQGSVRVQVACAEPPQGPRVWLRVAVRDTGIGLTAGQRERLFSPFQQGDMSATRQYGGTGLGLALCQRLVERMGGEIGVESVPGTGSTFWFTACLGAATEETELPGSERSAAATAPPHLTGATPAALPAAADAAGGLPLRPLDTAAVLPELRVLARMLSTGQSKSRRLSTEIASRFAGTPLEGAYARVAAPIARFDFATALAQLQWLAQQQDWTLS